MQLVLQTNIYQKELLAKKQEVLFYVLKTIVYVDILKGIKNHTTF